MNEVIKLDDLLDNKANFLLTYPRYDEEETEKRLIELKGLGVNAIELRGRHLLKGMPILGKGHVGLVVAAKVDDETVALKIRRIDADRLSLEAEAANLRIANSVSVGPELVDVSESFLLMEFIEGDYLVDWVGGLDSSMADLLRGVLAKVLDKTHRLDRVGLDHGELSRAYRHIMVENDSPRIIDFESASTGRRCANLTTVVHYLFFNRQMASRIGTIIDLPDRDELVNVLREYKREPNERNFRLVLYVCGLVA